MRATVANIVFAMSWVGMMVMLGLRPQLSESAQGYAFAALFACIGIGMASAAFGPKSKFGIIFPSKDQTRFDGREIALGIAAVSSLIVVMVAASFVPRLGLSKEWTISATIGVFGVAAGAMALVSYWLRRTE